MNPKTKHGIPASHAPLSLMKNQTSDAGFVVDLPDLFSLAMDQVIGVEKASYDVYETGIDELRKLNDELEQALRRSEKLAVAGRLIATLAHEINNPLESLMSLLHLLGSNPTLDDSARELVEAARQEVGHLANISRQTLAPHRETKLPVITKVSELLDDVLTMLRRRLESEQIEIRREYETEGEVTIYPSELRQALTNLISNAIDAMGEGGELTLSIEMLPNRGVAVRVADTGCGIPAENLDTIFEPLFTTKGENGTGIGLWVTKSIVEKVGGRIEVTSSTTGKKGTCFSIFLPAPRVVPIEIHVRAADAEAKLKANPASIIKNRAIQ